MKIVSARLSGSASSVQPGKGDCASVELYDVRACPGIMIRLKRAGAKPQWVPLAKLDWLYIELDETEASPQKKVAAK